MERVTLLDGREQYLDEYKGFPIAVTEMREGQGYSHWKYGDDEAKVGHENVEVSLKSVKTEIDELLANQ
ncbi:hypothetical protein CAL7716_100760 (plasmid) [Calothrix sp. PCC 7716]|nr:hypothetical protein CAL7716_100760 [Calothrix sp. PCC 7716]